MGWQHSAKSEKFNAAKILSNSLGLILTLIDRIQQWKIQEIWNPFHGQNYFILEGIFKLWTHEQQELPFLQMFISFANQNLVILCVKRISFFLEFLMLYEHGGLNLLPMGH